jgi:metal-sulfur cluster biosynthetic enzyme
MIATVPDPAVDALWQALREVADPELPISLVDLGLICDVRLHDGTVEVDLTFTASACPCMEFILDDIRDRLLRLDRSSASRFATCGTRRGPPRA